jgi:hypothetical protein
MPLQLLGLLAFVCALAQAASFFFRLPSRFYMRKRECT